MSMEVKQPQLKLIVCFPADSTHPYPHSKLTIYVDTDEAAEAVIGEFYRYSKAIHLYELNDGEYLRIDTYT